LIEPFPQHTPQSVGHELQVSAPVQKVSPQNGAGGLHPAVLIVPQLFVQAREPVQPAPFSLAQVFPPKRAPSQTSPASIPPFPHFVQAAELIVQPALQVRGPMKPAPKTVAQVAPPKSAPSQASAPSLIAFPQTGGLVQAALSNLQVTALHASTPPV
jgi:hypothetical protein